jgi:hypothetical protein
MDITKAAGLPTTLTILGRDFQVTPNRVKDVAEFTAWLHGKMGNPIEKVLEAFLSPSGLAMDEWAARSLKEWQDEQVKAKAENRLPDDGKSRRAEMAERWRADRRELLLKAYQDSYGAKPPLEDPVWLPWLNSTEGMCYDLWLALRRHHAEEFPTHYEVMTFVGQNLQELLKARQEVAKLNDPDPAKNSPAPPSSSGEPDDGASGGKNSWPTSRNTAASPLSK